MSFSILWTATLAHSRTTTSSSFPNSPTWSSSRQSTSISTPLSKSAKGKIAKSTGVAMPDTCWFQVWTTKICQFFAWWIANKISILSALWLDHSLPSTVSASTQSPLVSKTRIPSSFQWATTTAISAFGSWTRSLIKSLYSFWKAKKEEEWLRTWHGRPTAACWLQPVYRTMW